MKGIGAAALALAMVMGSVAIGVDYDIEQMQARLAAQEARMADQDARMNDLQAKLAAGGPNAAGAAEGVVSLRRNAAVSIGGLVTSKYTYTNGRIDSVYAYQDVSAGPPDPEDWRYVQTGDYRRRARSKTGNLELSDAEISFQIDVNEHFDAFVNVDLINAPNNDYYCAETYYVRWKNICESGFGLKVGRDALVFGEEGFGELGSYAAGSGDGLGETLEGFQNYSGFGIGGGPVGGLIPAHNGWDISGVTQVTPYWEGLDGKLSFELSLMQNVYDDSPLSSSLDEGGWYSRDYANGVRKYRSKNYGLGTMSARTTWTPVEDLKFVASIVNYRMNGEGDDFGADFWHGKNNTVYGLAANWRPCFFNRLFVWGQWVHGNRVYFHKGMNSDALNFGAALDLAEGLTVFAQGDYLRTSYKHAGFNQRGTAWAFYTGLQYSLPYGVSLEAGWKHERVRYTDRATGTRLAKARGDTIYAMCGFEF